MTELGLAVDCSVKKIVSSSIATVPLERYGVAAIGFGGSASRGGLGHSALMPFSHAEHAKQLCLTSICGEYNLKLLTISSELYSRPTPPNQYGPGHLGKRNDTMKQCFVIMPIGSGDRP